MSPNRKKQQPLPLSLPPPERPALGLIGFPKASRYFKGFVYGIHRGPFKGSLKGSIGVLLWEILSQIIIAIPNIETLHSTFRFQFGFRGASGEVWGRNQAPGYRLGRVTGLQWGRLAASTGLCEARQLKVQGR